MSCSVAQISRSNQLIVAGRVAALPLVTMPCRHRRASFNLATGELVTADRVDVGKPAPGKFVAPVSVWVMPKQ